MTNNRFLKGSCNEFAPDHKFNCVDIVKFICAILVVVGHIKPLNFGPDRFQYANFFMQKYLTGIIVPFYFTSSGFLLFRKIDINGFDSEIIKRYCFRILRLLGTWEILLSVNGTVCKRQLWYLRAVIVAVIILSVLIKKGMPLKGAFAVAAVLFIIGLFGDTYYGFIEPLKANSVFNAIVERYESFFVTTRNGVFYGLLYVTMGAIFAQKRIVLNNIAAFFGFFASFALLFAEANFLKYRSNPKDYNMFLLAVPTVFFLFYIATHADLKNRPIYGRLRVVGMIVFYTHLLINMLLGLAFDMFEAKTGVDLNPIRFLTVLCLSMLLGIMIERLAQKEKFKWLRYLYS